MIPFPGCQSKGDSLVTAPVTVLSPLGSYNLAHGFALQKAMERNTANIGGGPRRAQQAGPCCDGLVHLQPRWPALPSSLRLAVEAATALLWLTSVLLLRLPLARQSTRARWVARHTKRPCSTPSACEKTVSPTSRPNANGDFLFKDGPGGNGVNPNSAQFQAAQKACKSLAPTAPTPVQANAFMAQALKFSACMRKNGVANFPDPRENAGRVAMTITGVNPNTPQFQKAMQACQSLLPAGGPQAP